jgi:hypothetical protein
MTEYEQDGERNDHRSLEMKWKPLERLHGDARSFG